MSPIHTFLTETNDGLLSCCTVMCEGWMPNVSRQVQASNSYADLKFGERTRTDSKAASEDLKENESD